MNRHQVLNLLTKDYEVKNNEELVMYGYTDRNVLTPETNLLNNVITDKNNNILHYSGPFMNEKLYTDIDTSVVTEMYKFPEGTLLRLFYHKDKWCVATNRCLNARDSTFTSSISFLDMFNETINSDFYTNLDKAFCYCCVIKHTNARIVLPVDFNEVVIVSMTNLDTLETLLNDNYTIPITDFQTQIGELHSLIIKENGYYTRVFSDYYLRIRELKKMNVNNPVIRTIDLLTKEQKDIQEFLVYFPEYENVFNFVNNNLENFTRKVFDDYISLKIKKQALYFPKMYYMLLCRIHNDFILTRIPTTIGVIKKIVCETDTGSLRLMMFSEFLDKDQQTEIEY